MAIKQNETETCGIIMPISANDYYTADHWADVKFILEEVIMNAGFTPNLVSDADEIGIIHNRIVSNIYSNPIVICDVSSKNPNVMFELGLRLAFDKATIIIKDDITNYNFDTAPIEHLTYPKDLRYPLVNKFKLKLKEKLASTYKASLNPNYSTFLKNFVQYKPILETTEIGAQDYILKQLEVISKQITNLKKVDVQPDTQRLPKLSYKQLVAEVSLEFDIFVDRNGKAYFQKNSLPSILTDFTTYLKSMTNLKIDKLILQDIIAIAYDRLEQQGIVPYHN